MFTKVRSDWMLRAGHSPSLRCYAQFSSSISSPMCIWSLSDSELGMRFVYHRTTFTFSVDFILCWLLVWILIHQMRKCEDNKNSFCNKNDTFFKRLSVLMKLSWVNMKHKNRVKLVFSTEILVALKFVSFLAF